MNPFSMNPLKVILVGAGRVASHYSRIFNTYKEELRNLEVVGVIDTKEQRAKELALTFGCQHFTDIDKFTQKSNADLCLVLTPSNTHFEVAKRVLTRGINTVVEKPSTLLLSESLELQEIANTQGLYLATIHQNRFNKAVVFAKSILENNLLGSLVSVSIRLIWSRPDSYYQDEWHGKWASDGGVVSQQAFHHLDMARYLCGPISSLSSFGDSLGHPIEVDDTSVGIMKFAGGALGTFELTTAAPRIDREASISILGTNGLLTIGGIALNKVITFECDSSSDFSNVNTGNFSEEFDSGYGISHHRVLQEIYRDICNGTRKYVSWQDSIETLKLIHGIYASQEQRAVINTKQNSISRKLGIKEEAK